MRNIKNVKSITQIESESKTEHDVKKLNLAFIDFVKSVIAEPTLLENKRELENKYFESVSLKFHNIQRVYKRVLRTDLSSELKEQLQSRELELPEFITWSQKIVAQSRDSKESNYKTILVPVKSA